MIINKASYDRGFGAADVYKTKIVSLMDDHRGKKRSLRFSNVRTTAVAQKKLHGGPVRPPCSHTPTPSRCRVSWLTPLPVCLAGGRGAVRAPGVGWAAHRGHVGQGGRRALHGRRRAHRGGRGEPATTTHQKGGGRQSSGLTDGRDGDGRWASTRSRSRRASSRSGEEAHCCPHVGRSHRCAPVSMLSMQPELGPDVRVLCCPTYVCLPGCWEPTTPRSRWTRCPSRSASLAGRSSATSSRAGTGRRECSPSYGLRCADTHTTPPFHVIMILIH